VHVNGEVTIGIDLEVSNVVKEIHSATGLLAYQIGTRNASTMLRLRDGETQVLAGLLKDEQNNDSAGIPGLSTVPGVGQVFSNQTHSNGRSEIALLITPRIVRAMPTPPAYAMEFPSGTADNASVRPMRLTPIGQYSGSDAQLTQASDAAGIAGHPPSAPSDVRASAGSQPAPTAAAAPELGLQLPELVRLGSDFQLSVGYAQPYESIEFDLVMDQPVLELHGQSPADAQAIQAGQTIHVKAGKGPAGESRAPTVAVLGMRAVKQPGRAVSLSVQNLQVKGADGSELPAVVGLPRQLTVQQ
jgi:general secretion pathway protein D